MTNLQPSREVFITCAVTGSGDTTGRSEKVPITPQQIADSCIEAAEAGAAIVHIHVRDPETGTPARDPRLYSQVVDIIKESKVDMVINFTAGMGGDIVFGSAEKPFPLMKLVPTWLEQQSGLNMSVIYFQRYAPSIAAL